MSKFTLKSDEIGTDKVMLLCGENHGGNIDLIDNAGDLISDRKAIKLFKKFYRNMRKEYYSDHTDYERVSNLK